MEKILKFALDTPINSFQYLAYSSGILLADKNENNYQWLISHCLRIYHNTSNLCIYLPGEVPSLFNEVKGNNPDCFERHYIDLPNIFAEYSPKKLIDIIKKMIDYEFYIYGFYNEYYINSRKAYYKYNYVHDYLIIGYNDLDRLFYISGYTDQHIYQIVPVPFDNFIKALRFNEEASGHISLNFYKINKNYNFKFDIALAKKSIQEFNHPPNSYIYPYGKEALNYFKKEHLDNEDSYVQNIKAFSDYMNCFITFIEYLIQNEIMQEEELFQSLRINQKKCKSLVYMVIKFLSTNDSEVLTKIEQIKSKSIENIIEIMNILELKL